MDNKIIVIGAGAWGSALANLLAKKDFSVCLIANHAEIANEINQFHTNKKFLPNIALSFNLKASNNLSQQIIDADFIFIVTPSIATKNLLTQIAQLKLKSTSGLILCSKGLEHSSLKFFHQVIEEILPQKKYAILSGPNFAIEVAADEPTITTIATKNLEFAREISALLKTPFFKAEISDDLISAEICGIMKNIMAIGCGLVDGLGLGQNTKATLVCQGVTEIEMLCKKLGSSAKINNAAGFGDIFLTCSTTKSRNNSLGFNIAKGQKPHDLLNQGKTFEGVISANSINKLAATLALKLTLCKTVHEILENNFSLAEIRKKIVDAIL